MKLHSTGFSLFEFLIYNTLFCFLVFLSTTMIARTCMAIKKQGHQQAVLDISLVHDLFTRDIHSAPGNKKDWKKISVQEIIWHDAVSKTDKGWCWHEGCLYSIEGMYDNSSLHMRKSLVAQSITKVQFLLHAYDDEKIQALSLVIASRDKEQEFYVSIRTRERL